MRNRYACIFCGTELLPECNSDFSTLKGNVCPYCWQETIRQNSQEKATPSAGFDDPDEQGPNAGPLGCDFLRDAGRDWDINSLEALVIRDQSR